MPPIEKEAMLYERAEGLKVRCKLCARRCSIPEGSVGFCRVRKNVGGKLISLVYGKACAANPDPIEKKPLYHFHPGSYVFSIATIGCNFRCKFCDNWTISQETEIYGTELPPEKVVELAKRYGCQGISYTYTEPTIFFEYAYDTAKLAKEAGLFNTFVTNGYMTPEAVEAISPYLDAATVDFKGGGDPDFYRRFSEVPSVEPIYECLREMRRRGIHIEITNLVVPREGDSVERIGELASWIRDELGPDTPLHLLRFHPNYEVLYLPATPVESIEKAREAALNAGLRYVYVGNIPGHPGENTYCPSCGALLIERWGFDILKWELADGNKCPKCGERIAIVGGRPPKRGPLYPFI